MTRIIIDCDPGNGIPGANVDDALALLYAAHHPDLDVAAVWTVFGNTSASEGGDAARALLAAEGVEVDIVEGSDTPLSGDRQAWRARLDAPSQDPDVVALWGARTVSRRDERPGAEDVPTDSSNLAVRAVELLRREVGVHRPVAVHITKGIPVAGGMAGGSADAAAALVAADRLLGLGLHREELEARAAELGSDIPFCLRGGTVLGTGRGEALTTLLHPGPELHWVVATARGGLSTPQVYAELDRQRAMAAGPQPADEPRADALVDALASAEVRAVAQALGNDMQAAAIALMPGLRRTLHAGREAGALAAMVSGSGPTCVLLCDGAEHAVAVATELSGRGVAREVRVTRGPVRGAHLLGT